MRTDRNEISSHGVHGRVVGVRVGHQSRAEHGLEELVSAPGPTRKGAFDADYVGAERPVTFVLADTGKGEANCVTVVSSFGMQCHGTLVQFFHVGLTRPRSVGVLANN